jgi:dCTP deaminase
MSCLITQTSINVWKDIICGFDACQAISICSLATPMLDCPGTVAAQRERRAMGVMPDLWIREMSKKHGMIEPFAPGRRRKGRISYGTSSYGYDFRLADEFKIADLSAARCLDPKRMGVIRFQEHRGSSCLIPANSYILGRSLEYFRVPRDVIAICQGKSTYARSGLIVNVTPLEPGWEGHLTVALVNATPVPLKVYAREGIGQIVFIRGDGDCAAAYADRGGKYQAQKSIQLARV